jgi:hypothetical protein
VYKINDPRHICDEYSILTTKLGMTQTRYDTCAPPLKVPKGGVLTAAPVGVPQSHHSAMGAFDMLAGWGWVMGGVASGTPMA